MSDRTRMTRKFERMIGVYNARQENEYHLPLEIKQEGMTYNEALAELDEPIDGESYGKKMMASKTTGEIILKTKYGLGACSRDWPVPFYPTEKDTNATDYKIVTSTSEA